MEETKKKIFEMLGITSVDIKLINSRTPFMKKYSKLNNLIEMINIIHEETDKDKLNEMLKEFQELDKEHKLDDIRNIDIKAAVNDEIAQEYNMTATKYANLSDDELSKIEGVETFNHEGKRFIALNGAPFRFLGRSIYHNHKGPTQPYFTIVNSSLLSNIRPNNWGSFSTEFDIYNDTSASNYMSFGASDAIERVHNNLVTPEMLQVAVESGTYGSGYHTTIKFYGNLSASSSLVTLDVASDYEYMSHNTEWMPYDNIYVLNEDIYRQQAEKINGNFDEIIQENFQKQFSETADPEILYALLNSSNGYYDQVFQISSHIPSEKKEKIKEWIQGINFENCNDAENLRYIISFMETLNDLNSIHEVFYGIKEKCTERLQQIAKTRHISIRDKVEETREELNSEKSYRPQDVMIDFINHDIQREKRFGFFLTSESVKDNILQSEEITQERRESQANKIAQYAENIKSRQSKFNQLFETLGLKGHNDDMSETAYKLTKMSQIVLDGKKGFRELSDNIVSKFIDNPIFEESIKEWKESQKASFDIAMQERIQGLIQNAEERRLNKQIFSVSSQKIGFLGRLFGKKDYYNAVIQHLKIKKSKIVEESQDKKSIDDLLKYVKKKGMTKQISSFLKKYYDSAIISESQKKEIEDALSDPKEPKTDFLVPKYHLWEYKDRAKAIKKMNNNIMPQEESEYQYRKSGLSRNNSNDTLRAYVSTVWINTTDNIRSDDNKKFEGAIYL